MYSIKKSKLKIQKRMKTARLLQVCIFSFCLLNFALSQVPPDKDGLLNAEGMGQAKYAEMNGYPGPKHVLDLAVQLKLGEEQKASVQSFYNEMSLRAKEVAKQIIQIEQELNSAFAQGLVVEKSVRNDCEEIGRLRGKLRSIHLVAHMKTKEVLSATQIAMYKKLRSEGGKQ
jgi:hypothetical protein